MTGYSGTPLAKKLGIKDNFSIRVINAPDYYFRLFTDMPSNIEILKDRKPKKDFIRYFETLQKNLNKNILAFVGVQKAMCVICTNNSLNAQIKISRCNSFELQNKSLIFE